jgi:prepilin-type N-terminal cleavage/methylation domain-containing protein
MSKSLRDIKHLRSEEGFTLIELCAVILIIGILTAIAIPAYLEQKKTAIRAQVQTDLTSSAQSLSQWQQNQEAYNAVPTTAEFDSKIRIRSNNQTNIVLRTGEWGNNNTRQFCVEANSIIGGETYRVYYSLTKKEVKEGICPSFVQETDEQYS